MDRPQGRNRSDIVKDFKKYVSPGKVATYKKYGMTFVAGDREGCEIHDVDGRGFLNFHCNGGVFNLGHRNPDIIHTAKKAMDHLDIGNHHILSQQKADLAKAIIATLPLGMTNVIFGVSGGEACDVAIKLAYAKTSRKKVISMRGGYHGHTGLAVETGDDRFKNAFHMHNQNFIKVEFNSIESAEKAIDGETAAVIVETIPATLGMPIPSKAYFKTLRELCDRYGAVLIVDEVQTGLGRTGKMWAIEHYDIVPDILFTGKGLSGGIYPMTATCMKPDLYKVIADNPFLHVSTFGGSDIGCVVSQKVINITNQPEFLANVNRLAGRFAQLLSGIQDKYPDKLLEVRQLGLFVGLKFESANYCQLLCKALFENGVYAIYAANDKSVLQFMPPLIITDELLEEGVRRLEAAMHDLKSKLKYKSLKLLLEMMPSSAI